MFRNKHENTKDIEVKEASLPEDREIVSRLISMSGSQALNMILNSDQPGKLIRSMAKVDLFWLIKKIGEDDCLPLLQLASNDQWQYILDMEL